MLREPDPDASLMMRVKQGDSRAFADLVEKYKQPVINLVSRMLHDPVEAEDIAQNVFVQVYRSAHRYESTARFSTWLFTIAKNFSLNEIRRRSRHPAEPLETSRPDVEGELHVKAHLEDRRSAQAPAQLLRQEFEQKVEEAIADLPENQRLALLLCRQDELSYEEMAKILGCSVSAMKSLIHRGRETLKSRLKPYLQTGNWQRET